MERDTLRKLLVELLEDDTAREFPHLDDADNLREGLGLDSVDLVSLVVHTQSRLGIQIHSEELEKLRTVSDLLDLLQTKLVAVQRSAA